MFPQQILKFFECGLTYLIFKNQIPAIIKIYLILKLGQSGTEEIDDACHVRFVYLKIFTIKVI